MADYDEGRGMWYVDVSVEGGTSRSWFLRREDAEDFEGGARGCC